MLRRTVRNPSFRRLTSSLRAGLGLFHNKNSSVPKDTSTSYISIYLLVAWPVQDVQDVSCIQEQLPEES